jgi:hypothetical protein
MCVTVCVCVYVCVCVCVCVCDSVCTLHIKSADGNVMCVPPRAFAKRATECFLKFVMTKCRGRCQKISSSSLLVMKFHRNAFSTAGTVGWYRDRPSATRGSLSDLPIRMLEQKISTCQQVNMWLLRARPSTCQSRMNSTTQVRNI